MVFFDELTMVALFFSASTTLDWSPLFQEKIKVNFIVEGICHCHQSFIHPVSLIFIVIYHLSSILNPVLRKIHPHLIVLRTFASFSYPVFGVKFYSMKLA